MADQQKLYGTELPGSTTFPLTEAQLIALVQDWARRFPTMGNRMCTAIDKMCVKGSDTGKGKVELGAAGDNPTTIKTDVATTGAGEDKGKKAGNNQKRGGRDEKAAKRIAFVFDTPPLKKAPSDE